MKAEERIAEIERLVNNLPAEPNQEALEAIRSHLSYLRPLVKSSYGREKISDIETWAEVYFSQRKHQKHVGKSEQVAVWILAACQAVQSCLEAQG
jgi:hypothetical protein